MIKQAGRSVATKPTLVEIALLDGNSFLGKIAVPVQGRISDTLNDERGFIPVEMNDGSHVAIAKRAIKKVTLPAPEQRLYRGNDPHRVLGIPANASHEEIRRAYHRLCHQNHPDRVRSLDLGPEFEELATQNMIRINAAYAQLSRGNGV